MNTDKTNETASARPENVRLGQSVLYKLVVGNRIVAAGSKAKMKRLLKQYAAEKFPFIGIGSPIETQIGKVWNDSFPTS